MRGAGLAGFLYGEDFAALVLSALLADAVGQLALVAVGALRGAGGSEEVVAAAFGGALLGVAAFRIRHCCSLSIGPGNERVHATGPAYGAKIGGAHSSWEDSLGD